MSQTVSLSVEEWCAKYNIPDIFIPIFKDRGFTTGEELYKFFFGTLKHTHSSKDFGVEMEKAVRRIEQAMRNQERILVFGDYDVDGTTGTTQVVETLQYLEPFYGFTVDYMIPDRFKEGYGLSENALKRLLKKKPNLVITVDCGISNKDEISKLKTLGIDVIVTDHHEPKGELPTDAIALVHPKYCEYPFQGLSGSAVAYQVMRGLYELNGKEAPAWLMYGMLDMVALGAVCDIMPIREDNRIYVKEGLNRILRGERLALKILGQRAAWKKVTTYTLGFVVGPRINAAGRIDDAESVVELMLSKDPERCNQLLDILEERNEERKQLQQHAVEVGIAQVEISSYKHVNVVLDDLHEGVVGIAASKIMETYYRPTFVLTYAEDGRIKGSARSIDTINLFELIQKHEKFLDKWGGHGAAAGLTLKPENVEPFFKALDKELATFPPETWIRQRRFDAELTGRDISHRFFTVLNAMEPTGMAFPSFVWKIKGVLNGKILDSGAKIGKIKIDGRDFHFAMWADAEKVQFGIPQVVYGKWEWSDYHSAMQLRIIDAE